MTQAKYSNPPLFFRHMQSTSQRQQRKNSQAMIWRQIDHQETFTTFRVYSLENSKRHFTKVSDVKPERTAVPRHKQGDRVLVDLCISKRRDTGSLLENL